MCEAWRRQAGSLGLTGESSAHCVHLHEAGEKTQRLAVKGGAPGDLEEQKRKSHSRCTATKNTHH